MSLLNNEVKIYRPLAEGMYHVQFYKVTETAPIAGSTNQEGYVKFEGVLKEDGRTITDIRFQSNLNIMLAQVQQQLNIPDGLTTAEIANIIVGNAKGQKTAPILDLYVTKNPTEQKEYTNFDYMPRVHKVVQNAVESEEAFN